MCPEAKGDDTLFVGLVNSRELLRNLALGDIGSRGMKNINDKLTACQQSVGNEFACANGNGCRGILEEERDCQKGLCIGHVHKICIAVSARVS